MASKALEEGNLSVHSQMVSRASVECGAKMGLGEKDDSPSATGIVMD